MAKAVKSIKFNNYNCNLNMKTYDDNDNTINDLESQYLNLFKNLITSSDSKLNKLSNKSSEKRINDEKINSHVSNKNKMEYNENKKTIIFDFNKYIITILSELKIDNKITNWESLFEFSENSISKIDLLRIIDQYTEDVISGKKFQVDDLILEMFYFNTICFLKINSDCSDSKAFNQKNINLLYDNNEMVSNKNSQLALKILQKYEKLYNHEKVLRIKENIYYGSNISNNKELSDKYKLRGKAFYILGKIYYNGLLKLKQDYKIAYKFYRYGAINQNSDSIYNVAYCLENGIGTSINLKEAFDFYRLSYKIGYPMGMYKYAKFLLHGNDFIDRDALLGSHLLRLAAKKTSKHFTAPIYDLAMMYLVPNNNVIMDRDYGFRILSYGAELGCKNCQIKMLELKNI